MEDLRRIRGEVLELRFLQEYQGDPAGFWRVRFKKRDNGEERVKIIPARNLDGVSDGQIKVTKSTLPCAEALEQKVIRMKQEANGGRPRAGSV